MMRAAVVEVPGPPHVLQIKEISIPKVIPGWLLIRVKAAGLNRSEMYTRQGHSGDSVLFPRVLGIECVGEVADASDSGLSVGQKVAAMMGNMGREYDGGYAEYTLVPCSQVIPISTTLGWAEFGAIPETFITAYGAILSLDLKNGEILLVRGGTSSVGMAAITIAKNMGVIVVATTRNEAKMSALVDNGVDHVLIDNGAVEPKLRSITGDGVDAVLELVGQPTLKDSSAALRSGGRICQVGILGDKWDYWITAMPGARSDIERSFYSSEVVNAENSTQSLQAIVNRVEDGSYKVNLYKTFPLDEIVEAHRMMEGSGATGKIVVVF